MRRCLPHWQNSRVAATAPGCLLALLLGTFLGVRAQTIHQWPRTRV
ncbi:hypothetical protein MC885_008806 [Smutsia gigantea]|nr:hypothetical protein MC885_008806 [Smutsia gigantea]